MTGGFLCITIVLVLLSITAVPSPLLCFSVGWDMWCCSSQFFGSFQCDLVKEISVKLPPFHLLPSASMGVLTVSILDCFGRISSALQLHSDINFCWDPSKTWTTNYKIKCIQSVCLCNLNQLKVHRRSASVNLPQCCSNGWDSNSD